MTDVLASKFGAFLLFPEERYYGVSLPFGSESFSPENAKYLSTKQVLEDIVKIVLDVKTNFRQDASTCPVIAFGGSYGGTLTTFLRASHPDVVIGGLASSAPIGYYDVEGWPKHGVDEFTWSDIVYRVYDEASKGCIDAIESASNLLMRSDEDKIQHLFNMCEKQGLGPRQDSLFMYALESIPQLNYPYGVNALPAWPVNATCNILLDAKDDDDTLLSAAANITTLALFSGSQSSDCHQTLEEGPGGVPGDGPGGRNAWSFQSCTETLHEFSSRGIRNFTFSYDRESELCRKTFDATTSPDPRALTREFGGYELSDGGMKMSNIIWSNGILDPWHGGGFLKDSDFVKDDHGKHWIRLWKGAHHYDLRGPHPDDTDEVLRVREYEEKVIWNWIKDAHFEKDN